MRLLANCSFTDEILWIWLSFDALALFYNSAIVFNIDCDAVFDHITPLVGGLLLCHLGAHLSGISTLLNAIQQMKYNAQILLGVSEFTLQSKWLGSGTLQELEVSSCLWLTIACVLLGTTRKMSPGTRLSSAYLLHLLSSYHPNCYVEIDPLTNLKAFKPMAQN